MGPQLSVSQYLLFGCEGSILKNLRLSITMGIRQGDWNNWIEVGCLIAYTDGMPQDLINLHDLLQG